MTLSNFGGDLPASRVIVLFLDTIPGYIDGSRVNILPSIPTWVNYETQNQVELSGFGGYIPYTRIIGASGARIHCSFLVS